ncbi:MAG: L,D-transpeptidase family protein [Fimbriimonadales bacterium]
MSSPPNNRRATAHNATFFGFPDATIRSYTPRQRASCATATTAAQHTSRRNHARPHSAAPSPANACSPDAQAGYRAGRIDAAQRTAIESAIRAGQCPPWDTPLGGAIGIHGGCAGRDWTLGCIAVDDAHIERLYMLLPIGCPVQIAP